MHARKSLLFDNADPWSKKDSSTMFDVTMGSYDGAEVCELVGIHTLASKYNSNCIGLYRDDGLAIFKNMGPRTAEKIRKQFFQTFEEIGLKNHCPDQFESC